MSPHHTLFVRCALGYLALTSAVVGVWATFAPRSFYDDFPGLGRTWVAVDGPWNEHLVRDVGGLNLALTTLLVAAAVTLTRPLVVVAVVAALASGVPHLVYHLGATDGIEAVDLALSLTGLALFAALPLAILAVTLRPATHQGTSQA